MRRTNSADAGCGVPAGRRGGGGARAPPPPDRLHLLRSLGAAAIDYTTEDFTRTGPFDVVIDIPGNRPFSEIRRAIAPGGRYLLIGHDRYDATRGGWLGSIPRVFKLIAMSPFVRELPPPDFSAVDKTEAMGVLTELIEAGKLRPIVDRTFPLAETVDALRYLEQGRARGKVVIAVGEPWAG